MLTKSQILIFLVIVFILGIIAFQTDCFIYYCAFIAVLSTFMLLKSYITPLCAIVAVCTFLGSFYYTDFKTRHYDTLALLTPQYNIELEGTIATNLSTTQKGKTSFLLDVSAVDDNLNKQKINARTIVTIEDPLLKYKEFIPGDKIKISGNLFIPQKAVNPSQFDYAEYLAHKNVFTVFYSKGENSYEKISGAQTLKWKFLQKIYKLKMKILAKHAQYIPSPNIEIVGGIVLGDDAVNPPEDIKESFINSGLFHMLAASGMNVAIIFGMSFFILRKLRINERLSIFTGMLVVAVYTCMTGFPISLLRASIMLEFILLGKLINRSANTFALLFFAAFLLLLHNPSIINDLGFKLSFIVTLGLIFMAPAICNLLSKKVPHFLAEGVGIPLIAQFWVSPIQIYYFNTIILFSLFANILILPFFTITSFGGFLSFVLSLIPFVGSKIIIVTSFILKISTDVLIWISDFFGKIPLNILTVAKPSIVQIILYYAILLGVFLSIKNKSKKLAAGIGIMILILLITFIPQKNKNCEIIFFSVADADMILLKSPLNKYFMIDTGRMPYKAKSSQAKLIAEKYLKDRGVKDIEKIILTHYDSDHAGGAVTLMNDFKVNEIVANKNCQESLVQKKIADTMEEKHIKFHEADNNKSIYKEEDFNVTTFVAKEFIDNQNDSSILTLINCYNSSILFMGDAEVKTYEVLKNDLPKNIKILKVGHHGALKSINQDMLNDLNIKHAVISSGSKNSNHPHYQVQELLRKNQINIHRTGTDNAVKLVIDKDKEVFYHFDSQSKKFVEY